jgi:hypothetical protein
MLTTIFLAASFHERAHCRAETNTASINRASTYPPGSQSLAAAMPGQSAMSASASSSTLTRIARIVKTLTEMRPVVFGSPA